MPQKIVCEKRLYEGTEVCRYIEEPRIDLWGITAAVHPAPSGVVGRGTGCRGYVSSIPRTAQTVDRKISSLRCWNSGNSAYWTMQGWVFASASFTSP